MFYAEQHDREGTTGLEGDGTLTHAELPPGVLEGNGGACPGAIVSRSLSNCSEESAERLRKSLAFRSPGPQLSDFNPDKSRREMQKIQRLVQKQQGSKKRWRKSQKQHKFHDQSGIRISDGKDICDCQDLNCPGCHFPCPSCGSEKCGVECRCERHWTYFCEVDVENPWSTSSRRFTRR